MCSFAQEQDNMRRMLDQGVQRQAAAQEKQALQGESDEGRPTLTLDGKRYTVAHNANDVGRALYLSLQNKAWDAAQAFLTDYLTLADRDPMLVDYAEGVLARLRGHYQEAQASFEAVLARQPDFLLGRLELARVYFEDQQDKAAAALFTAIAASLDASDERTAGVARTVEAFQKALATRARWTGSFSAGPLWSDNINRSSASETCLLADTTGFCYVNRKLPDAVRAMGVDFDASVDKRWALEGHHGIYFRSLAFGQSYRGEAQYNELTWTFQAGYSFRSGRQTFAIAPTFDYYAWGNRAMYGAAGAHAEWTDTLSAASLLKIEGDIKRMRYRRPDYASQYDGVMRSVYATWFQGIGDGGTVFGGLDLVDSGAVERVNAYLQKGIRLGTSWEWPAGFTSTVFASFRHRDYGAYSSVLGERRNDHEQAYTVVIKASRFAFAGFTPVFTARRNRIHSNVDWLYSYDKNALSLKLEHAF
jgi:outer membrane protein